MNIFVVKPEVYRFRTDAAAFESRRDSTQGRWHDAACRSMTDRTHSVDNGTGWLVLAEPSVTKTVVVLQLLACSARRDRTANGLHLGRWLVHTTWEL